MKKEAERDVVKPKICKLEASEDADVKKYYKGVTNTKNDTNIEKEPDTKNENDIKKETNIEKEPDTKKQTNAKMKMKPTRLGPRSRLTSSNNATVSFLKIQSIGTIYSSKFCGIFFCFPTFFIIFQFLLPDASLRQF